MLSMSLLIKQLLIVVVVIVRVLGFFSFRDELFVRHVHCSAKAAF